MFKKYTLFTFILLSYLLFFSFTIHAKEYCHIHKDDELIETLELPFYFYENSIIIDPNHSMPIITYNSSYTLIDSSIKCDSIKVYVKETEKNQKLYYTVYDYTSTLYYNQTNEKLYSNSKLNEQNSYIIGYSSLIDEEPPIFNGYNTLYKTNIDNPTHIYLVQVSIYNTTSSILFQSP